MAVKMRLQRRGRKKRPFYHIVVADVRAPRDGRFIEKLGTYNPMTVPATIELDRDLAYEWLVKGAQPTDTVRAILRFKGVLYKKHLMRGVQKGALTAEEAEAKYQEWIEAKDVKVAERKAKADEEIALFHARISGAAPEAKEELKEIPSLEVPDAEEETAEAEDTAAEEGTAEAADAETTEETTVEEEAAETAEAEAKEEAPAEDDTPAEESEEEKDA
jgi:small subunit ribosomal protein S16